MQDSTVSLPRIIVPQDEFETMTTSSTSQSVQVVMSNNSAKSSSLLPQRSEDVKPADFGGLFVPESTTTTGRASSFGLKLNRVNTSMRRNEEVKDIDLSSLSNAGDLHSLKPSNSVRCDTTLISTLVNILEFVNRMLTSLILWRHLTIQALEVSFPKITKQDCTGTCLLRKKFIGFMGLLTSHQLFSRLKKLNARLFQIDKFPQH